MIHGMHSVQTCMHIALSANKCSLSCGFVIQKINCLSKNTLRIDL